MISGRFVGECLIIMSNLLFIVNPKAGLNRKKDFTTKAIDVFKTAGYDVNVRVTRRSDDGEVIVKEDGKKADLVVCMGGDGTLSEVVKGIIKECLNVPLGYIPSGSTNDFASSLNLKSNPKAQAEFIVSHKPRPIDVGMFNDTCFVYTASAGLFTAASYATPQKLKNRLGHLAYLLFSVKELFRVKKLRLDISLKDQKIEGKYIFVSINNAKKVGGVMRLDKCGVDFDDGMFELMLIEYPKNPAELCKMIIQVSRQKFNGHITLLRTDSVKIEAQSEFNWSLDGEKEKGSKYTDFHVSHDAINFIY